MKKRSLRNRLWFSIHQLLHKTACCEYNGFCFWISAVNLSEMSGHCISLYPTIFRSMTVWKLHDAKLGCRVQSKHVFPTARQQLFPCISLSKMVFSERRVCVLNKRWLGCKCSPSILCNGFSSLKLSKMGTYSSWRVLDPSSIVCTLCLAMESTYNNVVVVVDNNIIIIT